MTENQYLLANASEEAGRRFEALAEIFDHVTFAHFERVGIAAGCKVWEVGAGGTSVVKWLSERVGPSGHVLATDIDISWADQFAAANVTTQRHDVAVDPVPGDGFDLIHARLVLVHVPDRLVALQNMVRALRPGGWLLIEDADPALQSLACLDEVGPPQALANKIRKGFRQLMAGRGVDLAYGRKLPEFLRAEGLQGVCADCYFPVANPACNILEIATIKLIEGQLLAAELATKEELDEHVRNVATGALDLTTAPLISAWGRR